MNSGLKSSRFVRLSANGVHKQLLEPTSKLFFVLFLRSLAAKNSEIFVLYVIFVVNGSAQNQNRTPAANRISFASSPSSRT
jgi:hypothetical protein